VPGGFDGVASFLVLSGFLITSLVVREWDGTGAIRRVAGWRVAGGGWPGPLPPSTPSWITNLPCR
jgi:hypothetical protein